MRRHTTLRLGSLAAAACVTLAVAAPLASAAPRPTAPAPTHTMLVLLRSTAGRAGTLRARATRGSVAELAASLGAEVLATTAVPSTLTLRLTPAEARVLAHSPLVADVVPNSLLPGPTDPILPAGAPTAGASSRVPTTRTSCGTRAHPQPNPEALVNVHATPSATLGYTGKGVKVAFLADGLQITDRDFLRSARYASASSRKGSRVITIYRDFSGDGTRAPSPGGEAFLDASSIAAQGNEVYDLSTDVSAAHPLKKDCDITVTGSAPGATVYALKIFGNDNSTTLSGFVQAISYAVAHGVNVINESFGNNGFPDTAEDIVRAADDAAVAAGVTVVASSGDAGISSTIGSPATDPEVLSVGASTTFRAYQQDSFGGINLPGEKGRYLDNNISSLSSGGFAQNGKTVDLVAPGDLNWVDCGASRSYSDCDGKPFQLSGGTSESSPLTAGAAADVIEAYRATHRGTTPAPALVMHLLTSSATDTGAPANQQGAGLLDVGAAVRLALSAPGSSDATRPGGVLSDTSELNLAGLPSTPVAQSVNLTNTGSTSIKVTATTRTLVPFHASSGAIHLNPVHATHEPKFRIWSGIDEVYQRQAFRVTAGAARIQLQAAYPYTRQSSLLHVALFSPSGALAGYSDPQGIGDYADVEVARPAAGRWIAAFFTVWDQHGLTGTTGRVPWTFTELRDEGLGEVTPSSVTLAPGASAPIQYRDVLGATPGDASTSIVLREGSGRASSMTTIPVTLRTFVPIGGSGRFAGILTGGNGRDGAPGQTNTYEFNVPAGHHDLDVGLAMSSNPKAGLLPATQLIGELVNPSGDTVAYDTNFTQTVFSEVETRYLDLYAANPVAGTWQLILQWVQPGTGRTTAIPFTGSVELDQVSVSSDLPDSASTKVPVAGEDFTVTVNNKGVAPMIVSPDARLATTESMPLTDLLGKSTTQRVPGADSLFYVPTESSALRVTETASRPSTFDTSFLPGDPDLSPLVAAPYETRSWSPQSASLTYTPPTGVSAGEWNVFPSGVGPYPAGGARPFSETTTASVTTREFDPAVASSVPDMVEALTEGDDLDPAFVDPGSSTQITVTVTPTATPGTTVQGTLFVNGFTPGSLVVETIGDTSLFTSDLAAIPYEYTVQ